MRRSFKDLTKAINTSISKPTLPLPDDLVAIIHAYLEKHVDHDESDSQRLQEELLNIYDSSILEKPSRLPPFLAMLRTLKPAIRGNGRLLQWWDKLSTPVLIKLGQEKGLAVEARDTLLEILVYDEDDTEIEDAKATSKVMAHNLVETWLEKSRHASEELDNHSRFVQEQIQTILLAFGKKRPKVYAKNTGGWFTMLTASGFLDYNQQIFRGKRQQNSCTGPTQRIHTLPTSTSTSGRKRPSSVSTHVSKY